MTKPSQHTPRPQRRRPEQSCDARASQGRRVQRPGQGCIGATWRHESRGAHCCHRAHSMRGGTTGCGPARADTAACRDSSLSALQTVGWTKRKRPQEHQQTLVQDEAVSEAKSACNACQKRSAPRLLRTAPEHAKFGQNHTQAPGPLHTTQNLSTNAKFGQIHTQAPGQASKVNRPSHKVLPCACLWGLAHLCMRGQSTRRCCLLARCTYGTRRRTD
jgi:hypothetical protein